MDVSYSRVGDGMSMSGLLAYVLSKNYTNSVALSGVPVMMPIINNSTRRWEIWNPGTNVYVDTGVTAEGIDGITPHIGANQNWWIGTTDTGYLAVGVNGKSAYELWLEDGNTGTVEDFLNSLKGTPGGGLEGQVLGKLSNSDFDTAWKFPKWVFIEDKPTEMPNHGVYATVNMQTIIDGGNTYYRLTAPLLQKIIDENIALGKMRYEGISITWICPENSVGLPFLGINTGDAFNASEYSPLIDPASNFGDAPNYAHTKCFVGGAYTTIFLAISNAWQTNINKNLVDDIIGLPAELQRIEDAIPTLDDMLNAIPPAEHKYYIDSNYIGHRPSDGSDNFPFTTYAAFKAWIDSQNVSSGYELNIVTGSDLSSEEMLIDGQSNVIIHAMSAPDITTVNVGSIRVIGNTDRVGILGLNVVGNTTLQSSGRFISFDKCSFGGQILGQSTAGVPSVYRYFKESVFYSNISLTGTRDMVLGFEKCFMRGEPDHATLVINNPNVNLFLDGCYNFSVHALQCNSLILRGDTNVVESLATSPYALLVDDNCAGWVYLASGATRHVPYGTTYAPIYIGDNCKYATGTFLADKQSSVIKGQLVGTSLIVEQVMATNPRQGYLPTIYANDAFGQRSVANRLSDHLNGISDALLASNSLNPNDRYLTNDIVIDNNGNRVSGGWQTNLTFEDETIYDTDGVTPIGIDVIIKDKDGNEVHRWAKVPSGTGTLPVGDTVTNSDTIQWSGPSTARAGNVQVDGNAGLATSTDGVTVASTHRIPTDTDTTKLEELPDNTALQAAFDGKQPIAPAGMGFSSNDYTTPEKTKLGEFPDWDVMQDMFGRAENTFTLVPDMSRIELNVASNNSTANDVTATWTANRDGYIRVRFTGWGMFAPQATGAISSNMIQVNNATVFEQIANHADSTWGNFGAVYFHPIKNGDFIAARRIVSVPNISGQTAYNIIIDFVPPTERWLTTDATRFNVRLIGQPMYESVEVINRLPSTGINWTVHSDGYFIFGASVPAGSRYQCFINGESVGGIDALGGNNWNRFVRAVTRGDIVRIEATVGAGGPTVGYFVPPRTVAPLMIQDTDLVSSTEPDRVQIDPNTKEMIVNKPANVFTLVPDYAKIETINRIAADGGSWVVARDGFVFCMSVPAAGGRTEWYIDNVLVDRVGQVAPVVAWKSNVFKVSAGQVIRHGSTGGAATNIECRFIPPKELWTTTDATRFNVRLIGQPDLSTRTAVLPLDNILDRTWTATHDGYVIGEITFAASPANSNAYGSVAINDVLVFETGYGSPFGRSIIPVSRGDIVRIRVHNQANGRTALWFVQPKTVAPMIWDVPPSSLVSSVDNGKVQFLTGTNELQVNDNYSTTEHDTGKRWINSKPIYRQVLTGTTPLIADGTAVVATIPGMEQIVSMSGVFSHGTNRAFLNFYQSATSYAYCFASVATGAILVQAGATYINQPLHIIIEYTRV